MTDLFRTRDHVPDFDAISADYRVASAATRAQISHRLDLAYGAEPDERLDIFLPGEGAKAAPIHLFVHGGYWRANRKDDYNFIADVVTSAGAIAAIVDYSLMPKVRMARLVDQVRRAAVWLQENAETFGGDPARISASGHSAGAHLAFYLVGKGPHEPDFAPNVVSSVLLVSGLYDLAPISRSFLQAEIGLTPDEIAQWSPLGATVRADTNLSAVVGALETAPFHEQAKALAAQHGASLATLAGLNHMSIVRALGQPGTPAAAALTALIVGS
ncbi:hypothetical protein JP75_07400 [Devosia riboflavina]|uniref:BD-FAE-like domain-containing protein n=1 Tax=Devosia riboflavina TaxID=46914 RepID=A0A087M3D1_9HYPH|nr:alpha/beta hydrolase [Devosia riboflavina]KFL31384.1 hypothetical protein JP75_07400 [Devosia riboflavina]